MKRFLFLIVLELAFFKVSNCQSVFHEEWQKTYNGASSMADGGKAIAVDSIGNVYVAGNSTDTLSGLDFFIIKYNTSGDILWAQRFNGVGNGMDSLNAMAIDKNGNVYATGKSQNTNGDFDFQTIKYNSNGVFQWVATYNGTAGENDEAVAILADKNENVYIVGNTINSLTNKDFTIIKYDIFGNMLWVKNFDSNNSNDCASDIAMDNIGNILLTGGINADTGFSTQNIAILKYDSLGSLQWFREFDGIGNGNDMAKAIATDASNNVFITGYSFSDTTAKLDLITLKFDASGSQLWASLYNGPASEDDSGNDIEVDQNGNSYVCGSNFTIPFMGHDFVTIKYNSIGDTLWLKRYDGPGGSNDIAMDLAIDDSANVYVTGYNFTLVAHDFATIKYNTNGKRLWLFRFDGPDGTDDGANAIALDHFGNVYVTGIAHSSFTLTAPGLGIHSDFATVKYSSVHLYYPPDFNNEAASSSFLYYENKGQLTKTNGNTAPEVLFYTNTSYPALYFKKKTFSYVFSRIDTIETTPDSLHRIDMEFLKSNPSAAAIPIDTGQGFLNYFLDYCPEGITNVKGFKRLFLPSVYKNIDLHYYSNANGLKYYFVIQPGGLASDIWLRYNGADSINVDGNGDLVISSKIGVIRFGSPIAYQYDSSNNIIPLGWIPLWVQVDSNTVQLNTGSYNGVLPLVLQIDRGAVTTLVPPPSGNLEWSTYYGAEHDGYLLDVTNDETGNVYATGYTLSSNYPLLNGFQTQNFGSADAVVLKFEPYGIREWVTYFGGNGADIGTSITTDSQGNVFFTGVTSINASSSQTDNTFPVIPLPGAYNQNPILGPDYAFIVKLEQTYGYGIWATAFGDDNPAARTGSNAIAADEQGNVYIGGYGIRYGNFPVMLSGPSTCNEYLQGDYNVSMGFVAMFNASNNGLNWSTLFGNDGCVVKDISLSSNNDLFITGYTSSTNNNLFPIFNDNNAYYQQSFGGGSFDAIVAKFNNCHEILWSTFFGGADSDYGNGIVFSTGRIFIVGKTNSDENSFPLFNNGNSNSLNRAILDGSNDGFIASLRANSFLATTSEPKSLPNWSTYFGGNSLDECSKICVNSNGNIFITGNVKSTYIDTPTNSLSGVYQQDVLENSISGVHADAFVFGFDVNLNFLWSTYFGGEAFASSGFDSRDLGLGISSFSSDKLYVVGEARSYEDFPLFDDRPTYPNAYFQGVVNTSAGYTDGFISQFGFSDTQLLIEEKEMGENDFINVFPNPTSDAFTLQFNNTSGRKEQIEIYNAMGMLVYSENVANPDIQTVKLHLGTFGKGFYVVKLITSEQTYSGKVIIQ